jgi:hypothetical protein
MKRYIYIIAALIIGATSCQMTEGTEGEPMDIGKYIAQNTISSYVKILTDLDRALIADWFLSSEDEALRQGIIDKFLPHSYDYEITHTDNVVQILYRYTYTPRDEERVVVVDSFKTDGKLLSEGGRWIHEYTNSTITVDNGEYHLKLLGKVIDCRLTAQDIEMDIERGISYKLDGGMRVSYYSYGVNENCDVVLDTEIVSTLEYTYNAQRKAKFNNGGKIEAICYDSRVDRRDEVMIEFKDNYNAQVVYLGETALIKY